MPDLTISLVTANNQTLILDCLESIYRTTRKVSFEVYVVLNHSEDGSESAIRERFPQVNLLINRQKLGFTHNHNQVLQKARGKYVLVLNDDTIILDGAFDQMVCFMENHDEIGILGCRILNADGSLQWSTGKNRFHKLEYFKAGVLKSLLPIIRDQHFSGTQEVSWVTGACLLVRMKASQEVGLFDENLIIYYEDADWCYRMIQSGWKVIFYPDAQIIHYHGQTRKQFLAWDNFIIYMSRFYFFEKHYSRFILGVVKLLTILEANLKYLKTLVSIKAPDQRQVLLKTYRRVMRLALGSGIGQVF